MEKIICYDTLRSYCYSNDRLIRGKIRGIVVSFFGLGYGRMVEEDSEEGEFFARQNILYLLPYNTPWNWMNRYAAAFTDEILDVVFSHFDLSEETPIVSTGGSMGGLCALVYMAYAKRTPAACVANCPVCDLVYHYGERPDLPRTLYTTFYFQEGTLEEVLSTASPLHLARAGKLPKASYTIFHCTADEQVNKEMHSDRLIAAMRDTLNPVYYEVPGRGHCDLGEEMRRKYLETAAEAILKNPPSAT